MSPTINSNVVIVYNPICENSVDDFLVFCTSNLILFQQNEELTYNNCDVMEKNLKCHRIQRDVYFKNH